MLHDSKSVLAKLLAQENIKIEHRNVQTASFDLKNRVLVCPVWADMSSELYDLLLAHEVSHALNTPAQGWHDEITSHSSGFKTYLNVIEDARIERLIKQKYPGLRPSFAKAYQELSSKGFFGDSKMISSPRLPLIDRINLHFKIGAYARISFTPSEKMFLDKISGIETWEQVAKVAKELFELGKAEREDLKEELEQLLSNADLGLGESDEYDTDDGQREDFDFDFDASESDQLDTEDGKDDDGRDLLRRILDGSLGAEEDEPRSVTDTIYRQQESKLLSAESRQYFNVDIPKADLAKIVVPYKNIIHRIRAVVHNKFPHMEVDISREKIDQLRERAEQEAALRAEEYYRSFVNNNKKYVNYLIKEFELRRNASQLARASIAKTGKLDIKKVHAYRYNQDLFRRVTSVPGGKNHGLFMVIDFSGSMGPNMLATVEQTLVLAMFCRKANIPFRVYGFSDNADVFKVLHGREYEPGERVKFSTKKGSLVLGACGDASMLHMLEMLTSNMSSAEFNNMSRDWLFGAYLLSKESNWEQQFNLDTVDINEGDMTYTYTLMSPRMIKLNGTPLDEAIVSSIPMINQFRADHRLDIVNTIMLTDGDGAFTDRIYSEDYHFNPETPYASPKKRSIAGVGWHPISEVKHNNVIITDPVTKAIGIKIAGAPTTSGLLDLLRNATGSNVIGFYLNHSISAKSARNYISEYGVEISEEELLRYRKQYNEHRYISMPIPGYDQFYMLPAGRNLQIDEDKLVSKDNEMRSIQKAFIKMQRNKLINRVFLNKFVEQIA